MKRTDDSLKIKISDLDRRPHTSHSSYIKPKRSLTAPKGRHFSQRNRQNSHQRNRDKSGGNGSHVGTPTKKKYIKLHNIEFQSSTQNSQSGLGFKEGFYEIERPNNLFVLKPKVLNFDKWLNEKSSMSTRRTVKRMNLSGRTTAHRGDDRSNRKSNLNKPSNQIGIGGKIVNFRPTSLYKNPIIGKREKNSTSTGGNPSTSGMRNSYSSDFLVKNDPKNEIDKGAEKVNLSSSGLKEIPILRNGGSLVRVLNLQHNQISKLNHLHNLTNLRYLDLSDNNITKITRNISYVVNLRVLLLGKNLLDTIPSCLENLKFLEVLDMSNNNIGVIRRFQNFFSLKILKLNNNKISIFYDPDLFKGCNGIEELNFNSNSISKLQVGWKYLKQLKKIEMAKNKIRRFQDLNGLWDITTLEEVNLFKNPLCDYPFYKRSVLERIPNIKILDLVKLTPREDFKLKIENNFFGEDLMEERIIEKTLIIMKKNQINGPIPVFVEHLRIDGLKIQEFISSGFNPKDYKYSRIRQITFVRSNIKLLNDLLPFKGMRCTKVTIREDGNEIMSKVGNKLFMVFIRKIFPNCAIFNGNNISDNSKENAFDKLFFLGLDHNKVGSNFKIKDTPIVHVENVIENTDKEKKVKKMSNRFVKRIMDDSMLINRKMELIDYFLDKSIRELIFETIS